jgi:hypothetical protein
MINFRSIPLREPKRIVLDGPFWVIMREKERNPYFILRVEDKKWLIPHEDLQT